MKFVLGFRPFDYELLKRELSEQKNGAEFAGVHSGEDIEHYYNTESTAMFCVESRDEKAMEIFANVAREVIDKYCYFAERAFDLEHQNADSIPHAGLIIFEFNGQSYDILTRLNEEDVISLMFWIVGECGRISEELPPCFRLVFFLNDEQYVVSPEPDHIRLAERELGYSCVVFLAQKAGDEPSWYTLFSQTNYGPPTFRDYYVVQTESFGLLESDGRHTFINGYFDESAAQSGEAAVKTINLINRFISKERGDNFAISDLRERELCPVIERTDEAVTFFGGVEFRNKNGRYLNDALVCGDFGEWGVITAYNIPINLPRPQEYADLTSFNNECMAALNRAFCNAERFTLSKESESGEAETSTLEINRAENGKFVVACENARITLNVQSYPQRSECALITSSRLALIFTVEEVSFSEITKNGKEVTVSIIPSPEQPDSPRITLFIDQSIRSEGNINVLKNSPDFDGGDLPTELSLKAFFPEVTEELDIYGKIKDAVIAYGVEKCIEKFSGQTEKDNEDMAAALYPDQKMVRDDSVIETARQLKNEFERTGKIPNLAIVGQAGTGKTTLVKMLAEKIFNKKVLALSPSDLKGAYVGHTIHMVLKNIAFAIQYGEIVFIDEAYELMGDEFGREAVTILLPLMTGDRKKFHSHLDRDEYGDIDIDLGERKTVNGVEEVRNGYLRINGRELKTFPPMHLPVWLAGYEDEIRAMITQNQGLYRRLKKVVLSSPTTVSLLNQLRVNLKEQMSGGIKKIQEKAASLYKYFGFYRQNENGSADIDINYENLRPVRDFFGWGAQPQNSKYFASYAGVITFMNNCLDAIDFSKNLDAQINDIILKTKVDVKRQLSVVRKTAKTDDPLKGADSINVITDIDIRFSDLIGCDSQVAYMQSIIEMLVNKSVYENYNMSIPKGALMEGLPGTGKTFIAKAMAGELQERFQNEAPDKRFGFMAVSGAELGSRPSSYISSLFNTAEEFDACIMFIDEVDSIAKERGKNPRYENYLELIKYMDGIEKSSNVFILAATNAPEDLDPAFVRSGRIDKRLVFNLPDKKAREEFARRSLGKHLKLLEKRGKFNAQKDAEGVSETAQRIAEKTQGYTTRDIENIINNAFVAYHQYIKCNEKNDDEQNNMSGIFKNYPFIKFNSNQNSTPMSIDRNKNKIVSRNRSLNDLYLFIDEEIEKERVGEWKRADGEVKFNTDKNGNNRSSTAIHEVGHAVVNLLLNIPIDIITTMPRGNALGYVAPAEQNLNTKSDYEKKIRVCMGGRIAEEVVYGKDNISGGASQDMRNATHYARWMIEVYGFSDELGFMALSAPSGNYLGGGNSYICSEAFREKSDKAVNMLLQRLYAETYGMLADKKELIEKLAKEVFDKESMTGKEFKAIFDKALKSIDEKPIRK